MSAAQPPGGDPLAALRERAERGLRELVPPAAPVALLDVPSYPNVGDSAIWLGELAWLERNRSRVVYVASHRSYSSAAARRRVGGEATILLSGGGNLGDVYPWHQRLRERVIADFPGNRVVQLPVGLAATGEAALEGARGAFASHPDLTVLARDLRTAAAVRERLGIEPRLGPDAAHLLGPAVRPASPRQGILALLRADALAVGRREDLARAVPVADWVAGHGPRDGAALLRALKPLEVALGHLGAAGGPLNGPLARMHCHYAARRLAAGLRLLGSARVLITDRLHGAILAAHLGIPHVLLDDRTGKMSGYRETWPGVLGPLARSPEEALAEARALLASAAG